MGSAAPLDFVVVLIIPPECLAPAYRSLRAQVSLHDAQVTGHKTRRRERERERERRREGEGSKIESRVYWSHVTHC